MFEQLRDAAARVEADIASGPIVPNVTPQEIRSHLARYDFAEPVALDEACADVEWMLRTWHVQVTHPRYLGLFNPSVTPAAIIADTLVAMYNPQLASWRTSPAANEIERHTLAWLGCKFGFPAHASASFTTGGAEGNLSAVIVALTRAFPEYGERGLRHLQSTPAFYLTGETHLSFNKIAHMAGLGRGTLRTVATDSRGKMDLNDLASRVAEDRKNGLAPFMVVGTGGTTAAGVIDPLSDLARFCRSENLWFHVDAAWGGAAIVSPGLRGHLAGIEAADSITCDAHKWFSVPMGAGMFFCRHADAVSAAFHAEEVARTCCRSIRYFSSVVPAVYRVEAFSCAGALRRIRIRQNDRSSGPHGRRAAKVAGACWMAYRQQHAVAFSVLHPGRPR
jgi:glutamate/tyrosine decarboxylase-like PLP-dependent enzyme